jgi:anti-sigma-K factor RskA
MEHEEIKGLLAAYALGSVSADERREIERHVPDCDGCRAELADYEAVTGSLAMTVAASEPPVGFTEKVMTAAVGDRAVETIDRSRAARRWNRWGLLAGAALIAVVVVVGATILDARRDTEMHEDVVALLAQNEGIALRGEEDVIGRVAGTSFAIAGIDAAPEGKTYQLWLMRGDGCPSDDPAECELVSAGTFDPEDGVALVELNQPAGEWQDAAVTVEDDEGAEFPTTEPFIHSL